MVLADTLYSRWVTTRQLNEAELDIVLPTILEGERIHPIAAFLGQPACTEAHARAIRDTGEWSAFNAWYQSSFRTTDSLREFVATNPLRTVEAMIRGLGPGNVTQVLAEAAWDLGDTTLRIEIIKTLDDDYRPPKSWGAWLIAAAPFTGHNQSEAIVWDWCAARAPRFTWSAALAANSFAVMAKICRAVKLPTDLLVTAFGALEDYLETATCDSAELPDVVEVVAALAISTGNKLNGSPELTLAVKAYELADPAWSGTPMLQGALAEIHIGAGEYVCTYDEAVIELAGGPTDAEPILTNTWGQYDPNGAACAVSVSTENPRAVVDGLCNGRTNDWIEAFIREMWVYTTRIDYQIMCALQHLDDDTRKALIEDLQDPSYNRLNYLDLGTDATVLRRPVPSYTASSTGRKEADRLIAVTRARYGTDVTSWTVFDSLIDDFTGTYGELLEATELVSSTTA